MPRILGIDPGSRLTGFGLIDSDGLQHRYIDSGCIRINEKELPLRLRVIFEGVQTLIETHRPDQVAIESVFMNRNADSALKLGQARGAAICAAVMCDLPVGEYAPREIKLAVVGTGGAAKEQVQHMVTAILKLSKRPSSDAADALGVAICHANKLHTMLRMPGVVSASGGRLR